MQLFNSHDELQRDVYELCELVQDIASNTASRQDKDRRDVVDTPLETLQRLAMRQFVVRFDYNPFTMSPNTDPESELSLRAGECVTVFGSVDSVSVTVSLPFLRASAMLKHVIAIGLTSVRPSVRHTLAPYQNG